MNIKEKKIEPRTRLNYNIYIHLWYSKGLIPVSLGVRALEVVTLKLWNSLPKELCAIMN